MKIVFFFAILCIHSSHGQKISTVKSKLSPCKSFVTVECVDEVQGKNTAKMRCTGDQGQCENPINELTFTIDIGNSSTGVQKTFVGSTAVFEISSHTLGAGSFILTCSVTDSRQEYFPEAECWFIVRPTPPIPRIKGGDTRYVDARKTFIIDGTDSQFGDFAEIDDYNHGYPWSCTAKGGPSEFCDKVKKIHGLYFEVDAEYVIDGLEYTFVLTMADVKATQIIYVKHNTPITNMECLKNCFPVVKATDPRERTVVKLVCDENCEAITSDSVQWDVTSAKGVKLDPSQYNINNDHYSLTIESNVLKPGKYTISTSVKDGGGSKITIDVKQNPEIGNCQVVPSKGLAIETEFTIKCAEEIQDDITYKIFSVVDDKPVLLTKGPSLDNLTFKLPENAKVKLKVVTFDEFESDKELNVKVTKFQPTETEDEEELKKQVQERQERIDREIQEEIEKKNYDKAIQMMNANSEEINNMAKDNPELEELKKEAHCKMLDHLENIPIEKPDDVNQIAQLAASIKNKYEKGDPDIVEKSSHLCNKAAEKFIDILDKENVKGLSSADETLDNIIDCVQGSLDENNELTDELSQDTIEVTPTPNPALPLEHTFEQYEDYKDDERLSIMYNKMENAVSDMKDACYSTGHTIAQFTVEGEGVIRKEEKNLKVTVYKEKNRFFRGTEIDAGDTNITNSNDNLGNITNVLVICTTTKNAFWWLPSNQFETPLAFVRYDNKEHSEFIKPFLITFPFLSNETLDNNLIQEEFVYNKMITYRIEVIGSYHISFQLNDDEEYTILVTQFMKPTLDELQTNGIKVNSQNQIIYTKYLEKFHSWHFLNVLKEDKPPPKFTVLTYGCFKWDSIKLIWQFGCGSAENSTDELIVCECYSASILKGQRYPNAVRLEVFQPLEFELEMEPDYNIAVVTIVLFFLFVLLYVFVMFKDKKNILDHYIMFLADVPYKNKYAYLMIVHTERGIKNGTTSNVSIRLIGEKHSTIEHVVNYPDPERRLLQRGNIDWFVLASEHYLGRIMKIEIWFDSVGMAPNWKCRGIEIWDLQSLDRWYFTVMQLLSLLYMKDSKLVVEPEGTVKLTKQKRFSRLFNKPHFWALNLKSNSIFRLSVVYSIILNIFLLCVVFYGLPSIEETDSLSEHSYFNVNYSIVLFGLGSSLIVFMVYCPLVMLFRKADISPRKSLKSILYCCWIFIVVNIILCNIMLIVFGSWMSGATSLIVLSAVLIGVAFYAIVLEFIMKFFVKDSTKDYSTNTGQIRSFLLEFVEMQRAFIYSRFGHSGLRPYLGHFYEPLSEDELVSRKERSFAKIKALEMLEDLVMYLVYILLLYMVLLSSRESSFIYNNLQLKSVMSTNTFSSIYALWETNDFIEKEFMEDMQSSTWYPYFTSLESGLMSDKHNSYFGVARLRQSRGAKETCPKKNAIQFDRFCQFEYCSKPSEENHSRGWTDDNVNEFDRLYSVWLFFTKAETGAEGYSGKVCYYDGSGYLAPLGRTYKNSHVNFDYLRRNNWIDFSTRFLIIEFLSYNVHTNLFNTVEYVYEFSVTGAIYIQYDCDTARLLTRKEENNDLFLPIMGAFLVVLFILCVRLTTGFIKERKLLFKYFHGWLLIDITIIILCIVSLVLFHMRDILVNNFLSELEKFIFITISAILICISTLRLWKLLRFINIFKVFERTLALFFLPIINLFFCSLCFNMAFGMTGYFLFGEYSDSFKDFPTTLMNLALLSIGQNYLFDFADYNSPFHYLYHSLFMLISRCINSLYITIIIIHYEQARVEISNTYTYSLTEYVRDGVSTLYELIRTRHFKQRKRGGQDNLDDTPNVFPKSEEHRYANCKTIPTNSMKIMNLIAQTMILGRNVTDSLSKARFSAVTKLIYMMKSNLKSRTEVFFLDKTNPKSFRLIDDYRMLEMQKIAGILLDAEKSQPDYEKRLKQRYNKVLRNYRTRLDYYEEYVKKMSNLIEHIDSAIK